MKTFKSIIFLLSLLIVGYSCQPDKKPDKQISDIIGVYEYTGNLKGIAIFDKSHFAFTFRAMTDKPDSALTFEEKYNMFGSTAGTWTEKDSIVTLNITFDKDPKRIGTSFRFVNKIEGNVQTYRVIDENGNTLSSGSTIKIE